MKDSSVEDAIFSNSGKLFVDRRVTNLTLENLEPLMEFQVELSSFAEHKIKPWGKLFEESEETEILTLQTRKKLLQQVLCKWL